MLVYESQKEIENIKINRHFFDQINLGHGGVIVTAKGDKVDEALKAGADYAGDKEYLDKIKSGWVDVDIIISTPDMMIE